MHRLHILHRQVNTMMMNNDPSPARTGSAQKCCCSFCKKERTEAASRESGGSGVSERQEREAPPAQDSADDPYSAMLSRQGRTSAPRVGGCPFAGMMSTGVCPVTGKHA
ncbi:hypothetical protein TGPRC2_217555 [Toxoplasma gondii TgCatPRC2]|uniref:Uncharacterized protein n=4 Tax=Toxoplasma gondii TaxID=5811 RepID=B9QCF5_TOXGV|nr:hypothetical protein TGME49_217555 [Toxoplasma gondii ME49]ESS34106.1 hypothetical protein TGVEG_217555 [Toxoplasma gondii VEG]KYF48909.1 hypothetical protein TGARI_217555 [Toxoplasma gondii ARI]KYK67041.1 hypothetical protein TGPRC2_217555 [Toxoplasma gondii TgCatPRC2]EPT24734.1 hypothetical protein TGME49_217555 [Toxoplasma gondii ME49]CEL78218.1 TPA: hypothetical protein BN1205_006960 [Toxoplasma gondii VEG]|eukprot:XP_018634856.1 hypothetical protein TGME49_217555 [Toxoplasma gondii ME49]